jgi:hypothetical protein
MKHVYMVEHNGRTVECYGELQEDSNFHVVCDDERFDDTWTDGDPSGDFFMTWEDVVAGLQPHFGSRIEEISAC